MPTRYKKVQQSEPQPKPQVQQDYSPWEKPRLPVNDGLGIYARQSTSGQVKNNVQSNEMQTQDLIEFAKRLGWMDEQNITLFAQDMARSGTLKIVDREGMLTLIDMIRQGVVKAVLAAKEDRMFRDETALEYNTFIQVCKQHNCLVIIPPYTIYNFANKRDVKEFRYQCEKAADFLDDYVERLKALKERAVLKGYYAGGFIPIGSTIDRRKTIVQNDITVPNPTWKKFIRYEPHAQVIDWCLEQFYTSHNLNGIVREAESKGIRFPEFPSDIDQRSRRIAAKKAEDEKGGYIITVALLVSVFTNIFYEGHLVRNGSVIIENDHEIIVKNITHFKYAFNYLSTHSINGDRREDKPAKRFLREESDEATLLKYVVASDKNRQTFVKHHPTSKGSRWAYSVVYVRPNGIREHAGEVDATLIDECFLERFRQKIAQIKAHQDFNAEIQAERTAQEARRAVQKTRLEVIKLQRANNLEELQFVPPPDLPEETRKKLALTPESKQQLRLKDWNLAAEQQAIELELEQKPAQTKAESKALRYKHLVLEHADQWEGYAMSEKHKFLQSVIKEVEILYPAPHWIEIKITWINPEWGIDLGYVWDKGRKGGTSNYTDQELEIVKKLYSSSSMREILVALPNRTWQSIIRQAYILKLCRKYQLRNDSIPPFWTMDDIAFADEKRIDASNMMMDKYVYWLVPSQMGSS